MPRSRSATGAGRRLLAASVPVGVLVVAWAGLEDGARPFVFAGVAGLSLVAALPARLRTRIAVAALTLAVLVAATAGPSRDELHRVVDRGLRDIYALAPPFAPGAHHEVHVLVVLTAAAFCLAAAATAGSHRFVAAAVTAAGVGWPATVMPAHNTLAMGALGLLGAIWPLAVAGVRDRRSALPGATVVTGVVLVAFVLAGAGAKPTDAALDWQSWDLFGESGVDHTVASVWTSNYNGIDFPAAKTTVLRVVAPHRALYWRATTLDLFAGDRWVEALYSLDVAVGRRTLPPDPLLPGRAERKQGWVKQEVDVRAPVDSHVIGAGQPVQIDAGPGRRLQYQSGGVMRTTRSDEKLRRYTVWSYAPRPSPAALVRSPPTYPRELYRFLDVGRTYVPAFGWSGRAAEVDALFEDQRYQEMWPYRSMWTKARQLTDGTSSPYQATVRIERWLRSDGGFGYDEHPPAPVRLPPLVDFLQRSKLGYCQQFAGTMALMLRYLGIPARVAVGFTSGTWQDGEWTVTDHDAHAWVEAWFAGYGWLTFDPTPGRGRLSATYTNASDSADAIRALGGRFLGSGSHAVGGTAKPVRLPSPEQPATRWWPYLLPPGAVLCALLALAAVKAARRGLRARAADPRARASAARAELVDFLRDQGSTIGPSSPIGEIVAELRRLGVSSDGFATAFSRARYGPPGGTAAADEARRELRRVLSLLRERVGPGSRIRGFLAVRSLRSG